MCSRLHRLMVQPQGRDSLAIGRRRWGALTGGAFELSRTTNRPGHAHTRGSTSATWRRIPRIAHTHNRRRRCVWCADARTRRPPSHTCLCAMEDHLRACAAQLRLVPLIFGVGDGLLWRARRATRGPFDHNVLVAFAGRIVTRNADTCRAHPHAVVRAPLPCVQ